MTFINIFHSFSEKIRLDVLSESSAKQRIHMKLQILFSSKNKSKKIKVSSAAIFVWRIKVSSAAICVRRWTLSECVSLL